MKNYYINNNEFYEALKRLYDSGKNLNNHPDGNYIGDCILKICKNLAYSINFIGYTYRDELIEDGIENCIRYIHSFNPYKSKYAFTYFSKVAYYAFIRRLKKEKEQQYIRYKLISDSTILREFLESGNYGIDAEDIDDPTAETTTAIINSVHRLMRDSDKFLETTKIRKDRKGKEEIVDKDVEDIEKEHENSVGRFL